jgi:hypothetical protein
MVNEKMINISNLEKLKFMELKELSDKIWKIKIN